MTDVARALSEPGVEPVMFNPLRFGGNAIRSAVAAALALPGRAMTAAGDLQRQGDVYDPAPAVDAAMMTMGGTAFGAPKGAVGAGPPIRAYHGSPHDFERFDMSKIGTGEGAQAYGHGLYFAENEGVARAYKKNLAPAAADITPSWKGSGWQVTTRDGGNFGREFFPTKEEAEAFAAKFDKGRMYEVNINAAPEQFLDWDKPLSQQPKVISDIAPGAGAKWSGEDIYKSFAGGPFGRNPGMATDVLREAGIPGIRYLDQGSRKAVDLQKIIDQSISPDRVRLAQQELDAFKPSSNYVVFNDKLIDILRKYQIAGIAPPAALTAAAQYGGGERQ